MSAGRRAVRQLIFCGLGAALLFLAGCAVLMESGSGRKQGSTLTQSSYAAADMLIQQSRSFLTTDTPLVIGVLTDLDSPNERTNFGSMVAEQIASRFVQLGYNVTVSDMQSAQGPATIAPPPSSPQPYGAAATGPSVITGRYAVARDGVLVNLRIVEAGTGRVLAAFDYTVPKTPDVRELTKTKADKASFFDF